MPEELRLNWHGIVIGVCADAKVRDLLALPEPWLAWGWRPPQVVIEQQPSATLEIVESRRTSRISHDGTQALLVAVADQILRTPSVAIRLIHSLWVMAAVARGWYPIHAAAISLGGRCLVLLGASGSGKSVTAFEACRSLGALVLAADLAVLRRLDERAELFDRGESTFRFRTDALPLLGLSNRPQDAGDEKVAVSPEQAGILVGQLPVVVHSFVFVQVDAAMRRVAVVSARDSHLLRARFRDALWHVPRLISGAIRLGATTIDIPLRGGDRKSHSERNAFSDALVDAGQVVQLTGPLDRIVAQLGAL